MKNSRLKKILISTLFLIIILPIVARVLIYIIEDIKFNVALLKEIELMSFVNLKTYIDFFNFKKFHVINVFCWVLIGWNIILQLINDAEIKRRTKYEQNVEYGSHGTARFQTKKEMKSNYSKDKLGWFIGCDEEDQNFKLGMNALYHPIKGDLNMQITVIGAPGSQKTTGYVLPNIFHLVNEYKSRYNELKEMPDMIITDPKSELYCLTSEFLEENGYNVVVYDFIFLKYGNKFNSLDFINTEKELIEIASGYINSVEGSMGGNNGDSFWSEQEGQALAALLGAVKQNFKNPKFDDVLKLLTNDFANEITGSLDVAKAKQYFDNNVKNAPLQLWKNFLLICESENTSASILGGLAGKLKLFAIDSVRDIMSASTFNIKELGSKIGDNGKEKPTAVFIFMPDSDRTFAPLINVTISTIFKQLYKTAYDYHNKLASPVYFIIEEMANIGKISNIQEMLGTMRGRRIYPMMIWQSLAQMRDRYEKGYEDILSMCDTQVYLGVNDDFTAKYCSDSLGNTTIKTQGVSTKSLGYGIKDESESNNYTSRKLMFPEEIKALSRKKLIMSQGGRNPILIEKVQYKYWEEDKKICDERSLQDLPLLSNSINKDIKNIKIKEHEDENEKERERENNKIYSKDIINSDDVNKLEEEKANQEEREELKKEVEKEKGEEMNYFKKREKSLER